MLISLVSCVFAGCLSVAATANTLAPVEQGAEALAAVDAMETPTSVLLAAVPETLTSLNEQTSPAQTPASQTDAAALHPATASNSELVLSTPSSTPPIMPSPSPSATATPSPTPPYTITEVDSVAAYVNAKTINLRSGPGTGYEILGEYERYDTLKITGKTGEWYRVKIEGETGFMLKAYVTVGTYSTPSPTPSATPKVTATPKPAASPAPTATAIFAETGTYSESELLTLARLVHEEAYGTSLEAQMAIANVILNRISSSKFPNTVDGVVYQTGQFTPANDAGFNSVVPSSRSVEAVSEVFVNGNIFLPANVLYFRAASLGTSRSGYIYYATYGGNAFFSKD